MQNKLLPVLIAATLITCGARAQSDSAAPAQAPAPAPQAAPAAQPVQTAPSAPAQGAPVIQAAPAPNQVIYAPRLPSSTELASIAAAQGLTLEQINQTATQVTAIYRNASGQTTTVAYQLLPTNSQPATATVVVPNPAPTVIYETAPRTVYYDDPYYYPRYYYPPVSLSLGFGYYHGGWGHGGWGHGGWGHGRWH